MESLLGWLGELAALSDSFCMNLAQVRHDIDSSVDFAVFAGDKLFGLKGGI